jgi:8-oxo-dGTP pyrophosphatase MutT (NUDIX family)
LSTSAERGPAGVGPAIPRPAATVILVRDGAACRPEVFMVRRDPRSQFAGDAFVFPGGTVQRSDRVVGGRSPYLGLTADRAHRRLSERGGDPPAEADASLALHAAAVRELYEEAGVLLARPRGGDGSSALSPEACEILDSLRPKVQQGRADLAAIALDLGLELLPEELVYFSHWITPESSPRRYDTRFFVVADRPDQTASHCGVETVDGAWVAPAEALRRFEAGEIQLVSVTVDHLKLLGTFGSSAELLAFARAKRVRTVRARRGPDGWDLGGDGAPW